MRSAKPGQRSGASIVTLTGHSPTPFAGVTDPSEAVIDEVAGQCLTLTVVPLAPLPYLIGFLLFDRWVYRYGLIGAFAIVAAILLFVGWMYDKKHARPYDE